MRFYDLFAGIGGFRLGLERAGHECVGSCEIDKYARQIYAKNFGHEPTERDAKQINTSKLPEFEILVAGFPCQSWSIAGQRRGFQDARGTLCFEILRIAREKQPPILLLENVKGLLSHSEGSTFRYIIEAIDELGYDVEWIILNSKNYGVAQNRERVFIAGHLRGSGSRKIFPVGQVGTKYDESLGQAQNTKDRHSGAITANYYKGWGAGRTMIAEPKLKLHKNSKDDSYRVYETDGLARTLRANSGGLGSKTGVYNMGDLKFRKLTPMECERLQGFPDNFTSGVSDTQRYRQLGNAVTVNVTEYLGGLLRLEKS